MIEPYLIESVVLADTQYLTGEALRTILTPYCKQFYTVNTKSELEKRLADEAITLLIIDFCLFNYQSIDDLAQLIDIYPATSIVIVTNSIENNTIKELHDHGIKNIILKTDSKEELFQAIYAALKHKKYYSESVLDILIKPDSPTSFPDINALTPSEIEIVRHIACGLSTKQIAAKKHLSFHTVTTHRKNIFKKLGVSSSSEMIMWAIKAGLIDNIEYHI